MRSVRNIAFSLLVLLFLFLVIGNRALLLVPGYDPPNRSYLEGREYQQFPDHAPSDFFEGRFQAQFEQFMADGVPKRNGVLYYHARLQRVVIELANIPFGYASYPTYYGSGFVYTPSNGIVAEAPFMQKAFASRFDDGLKAYSAAIEGNPDVNWVFFMPEEPGTFGGMPVSQLVNGMADYEFFKAGFLEKLPDACTVVDGSYVLLEEYLQDHFRTDHHWQVQGAMKGYRKIMSALGRAPIEFGSVVEVFGGPYWGAGARNGIISAGVGDVGYDVEFRHPSISVEIDGEAVDDTWLCESFADPWPTYRKENKYSNFYGDWFHRDRRLVCITNNQVEDGVLVIVGDSFTNAFERFFAPSYHTVIVLDPREYEGALSELLVSCKADDVVFVMSASYAFDKAALRCIGS